MLVLLSLKNPLLEGEIIASVFHSNFTYIHICLSQQKRKIVEYAFNEEKFLLEISRMNNTTQVGVGRYSVLVNGVFVCEDRTQHILKEQDVLSIWPPVAGG